jgi:hypothetical protein
MSDELRLPDDLAALEARLAAQSLPASGLSRDELLYRAGWEACDAQSGRTVQVYTKPARADSTRIAAWSFVSAALAASLAVAATLHLESPRGADLDRERNNSIQASYVAATKTSPPSATPVQASVVADYLALVSNPDARDFVTPLLAFHRRQLRFTWPASAVETVANGSAAPAPKTASQLRQEFLPPPAPPSDNSRRPIEWPWSTPATGESI